MVLSEAKVEELGIFTKANPQVEAPQGLGSVSHDNVSRY